MGSQRVGHDWDTELNTKYSPALIANKTITVKTNYSYSLLDELFSYLLEFPEHY